MGTSEYYLRLLVAKNHPPFAKENKNQVQCRRCLSLVQRGGPSDVLWGEIGHVSRQETRHLNDWLRNAFEFL